MTQQNAVWIATLPCSRADAERIDAQAELIFADDEQPPILSFMEAPEGGPDDWLMQVYFEGKPNKALLDRIGSLLPDAPRPKAERVEDQDWVTLSQEGLPPITAGRFHVRNGEDTPPVEGLVNFLIPASRAFGTGQHETTHGCLAMLDDLRTRGHRFGNVADIGTGTGLLAFAALALWPRAHVIASDIDPASVEVTTDNITLNGLGSVMVVEAAGMDHAALAVRAPYDLIIANILAGPLISLAPAFAAHLEDGGSLILAGLLDTQADAVIAACRRAGLRLAARSDRGQWPTLHLRKRRRFGTRRPERWQDAGDSVAPGFGSW